jgi:hypothetical protein
MPKRTIKLSSSIGKGCEHCGAGVGPLVGDDDIANDIDHYVNEHGYKLLHVGTETNHGPDGKPWHNTVAILEHDNPPAILPPPEIKIGIDIGGVKPKK